jgi:AcrR family transcriptional regulator
VRTPWGDSEGLRARRLRAGQGQHSRAEGERNQRERLFAALVATVERRGYEAATVADLVRLSGVSRSAFYRHFDDKQDCFLAAVDTLTGPALERLAGDPAVVADEERTRTGFVSLVEAIAAQPAAARMCLVEIHAAGPEGTALLDQMVDGLARLAGAMLERIPGRAGMPPELVRALVGGVQRTVVKRLLRGEGDRLGELAPQLWEWMLSIAPPPGPLQSERRRLRPRRFAQRQDDSSPTDRVLRAMAAVVAERGYGETTVADVVERARTSQRTFYRSFRDREEAMTAALDSGSAQMIAAALPAFREAGDWPRSVRATLEAMLRFAAEEPEYGRLGAVGVYAAGGRALEQRETVAESLEALLAVGFELNPRAPQIAPEAIGGALSALLYDFVKANGPERLLELAPAASYVALAPFVGGEEAYAVAVDCDPRRAPAKPT